jgi:hypothetical protein
VHHFLLHTQQNPAFWLYLFHKRARAFAGGMQKELQKGLTSRDVL